MKLESERKDGGAIFQSLCGSFEASASREEGPDQRRSCSVWCLGRNDVTAAQMPR
jgi:hypothetical protein